ncbi:Malonyl CoA-acyl carrier protein transacylase [Pseudonocardia sp. Ae150A_Ps1]|nr:Malonyl CoA-acyl carrier protein transacylase [Pseudonocardia sp. Ae150A_Ps1]
MTAAAPDTGVMDAEFWTAVEQADLPALTAALGTDEASVAAILPGLSAWRRSRADRADVDAWRYRVEWATAPQPPRTGPTGDWLVVSATGTDPADVAGVLAGHGAGVRPLVLGDDDTDRGLLRARIEDATAGGEITGVVSLLAAAEDDDPRHPGLTRGLALSVALVQALGDAGSDAPLWHLTRGTATAAPGDTVTRPLQSQVAALGWTAAVEHPHRRGGTVDLPEELDARTGDRLAAVLAGRLGDEDQLAVRPSGVLTRRIVRAGRGGRAPARNWSPRGTTVVTGGSGTLAPDLARRLAADGAEHVVLLSRRGADAPGTAALVAELADAGTEAEAVACDITDRAAVAALLDRLAAQGRTVGTVLHTAAVIGLAAIADTTVDEFAEVVHAKVTGARILDELLDDPDTDLVLYSSTAGMWGSGVHAAYAAGNAFLSALAQQRRARGLRATSVHWGKWPDADSGRTEADPHRIRRSGLEYLDPQRALTGLRCVLDDDETVVGLMDIDWDVYNDVFTAGRPSHLFDAIPEVRARLDRPAAGRAGGDLAARLQPLSTAERSRLLITLVRTEAAAVLGHASADAFGERRAFRDAGFDSVTAVDLRNRLAAATGLVLPSTLVFDHPNPAALAGRLEEAALGAGDGAQQYSSGPAGSATDGDPIAVIGMSCRYPGGADTPEALLRLALDGVDAITGFPAGRGWDAAALHDPDPDRPHLLRAGRIPAHRRRLRRRVLRDLPARGDRDGPAATDAAGDLVGGVRARRDRPRVAARQQHRHLCRRHLPGLRDDDGERRGRHRDPHGHRHRRQRAVRPGVVPAGPGGARRHPGHGVLVVAGRDAPGLPVAAQWGELAGTGRRRRGDGDPAGVRRVQPAAGTRRRRPLQAVLRGRRRDDPRRGRRRRAAGAALRRAPPRAPGARRDPRVGDQPGRRLQRADRAERAVTAACDPPGAGRRGTDRGRRRRRRGTRHRHRARRPDRGPGAPRDLRPRPGRAAAAGVGEVRDRAHAGRRGRRRSDHDDRRDACRGAARHPAPRRADQPRRLDLGGRRAAHRPHRVAGDRPAAPGRGVVVRDQRHQRPRPPRTGGPRRGGGAGRYRGGTRPVGGVRPLGRRAARPGGPAARRRRARPAGPGPDRARPGHDPRRLRPPRRRRGGDARRARPRPDSTGRRHLRGRAGHRHRRRGPRRSRLRVPGAGRPVVGDGPRAARDLRGVPHRGRRLRRRAGPARRLVAARRPHRRRRPGAAGARRRRPARAVRDDGRPRRGLARPRRRAGRGRRALAGRDRRRVRGGCARPRRRGPRGGAAQPRAAAIVRARRDGVGRGARRPGHGADRPLGRRAVGRRGERAVVGGRLRRRGRARRTAARLRVRRGPRPTGLRRLRLARPARRGGARRARRGTRPRHPAHACGAVLLHRHRRAPRHRRGRRRRRHLLVHEPPAHRPDAGRDRGPPRGRAPDLRRGQPAPGARGADPGDPGGGRPRRHRRRGRAGHAAPRRGRTRPGADLAGRGVRARRRRRLDDDPARHRWRSRRPADLRVPAPHLLARAEGGPVGCRRRRRVLGPRRRPGPGGVRGRARRARRRPRHRAAGAVRLARRVPRPHPRERPALPRRLGPGPGARRGPARRAGADRGRRTGYRHRGRRAARRVRPWRRPRHRPRYRARGVGRRAGPARRRRPGHRGRGTPGHDGTTAPRPPGRPRRAGPDPRARPGTRRRRGHGAAVVPDPRRRRYHARGRRHRSRAGHPVGSRPGRRPRAPRPVGRADRPARRPGRPDRAAGRRAGRRGRDRGPARGPRPRSPRPPAHPRRTGRTAPRARRLRPRHRAGDRRHRWHRRADGAAGRRARRRAPAADQPPR